MTDDVLCVALNTKAGGLVAETSTYYSDSHFQVSLVSVSDLD